MFRLWFDRARLIAMFVLQRPWLLLTVVLAGLRNNLRIWWFRRGRRVWILSIEESVYLPFIQEAVTRIPETLWNQIMLIVACRSHATTEVKRQLDVLGIRYEFVITNWACASLFQYDLFLTTHQSAVPPLIKRGERVCSFHGLPAKGGTFVESQWRFLDGALLIGPLQKRMFEQFQNESATGARLWGRDVGLIKSDRLVNGDIRKGEVLRNLGLSAEVSTVLYAPSWEEGTSLRVSGRQICERLCQSPWNVIVKLHPMSYFPVTETKATGGIDWSQELAGFDSMPRYRHPRRSDITPLVCAADVVVTDVSSIAFEAMLIDRPVVFIDCPEFFERTVPGLYGLSPQQAREDIRYNCGRSGGTVIESIDDLPHAIQDSIRFPDRFAAERKEIRDQLVFNRGSASQAAARTIIELLALPGHDDAAAKPDCESGSSAPPSCLPPGTRLKRSPRGPSEPAPS